MSDMAERLNTALEGRYAIERELGEGGMATVYLADDLKHERKVALKVLKPELAAVVGAERFLAEIKTTANLQHPHILPLFDSGEADNFLFYVMPYVEGETLADRINREKQLPVDEAVAVASKVAGALQHAHEHGVIHRDIKPGNILLQDGEPVVADFGIALAVGAGGSNRLTETGLSLGTPHYMSPEQATGDQAVGASTDTYALGSVLYEMLVGEPPYPGTTAQAVLGKIIAGKPVSVTEQRPSVPTNVDAAVRKALEKLSADRFTSARDFMRALGDEHFRYGELATAGASAAVGPWNRLTMAFAALFALTLAWSLLRPEPLEPPPLVTRFEVNLPEGLELYTEGGVGLAMSPDGSRIVFTGSSPGGGTQLWLKRLDQLTPTPIPGTGNGRNPRFSPDGTSIAFTSVGSLTTVSFSGGPPLTVVTDSVNDGGGGLAWGPDGMLYFRKFTMGIWRVPASGGEEQEITTLTEGEAGQVWPEALPNGRGILFTRAANSPSNSEIAVVSLDTGEIRTLLRGAMARYAHSGHIVYASGEGTLLAAPFDVDRLEVTGPSHPFLEGVEVLGGSPAYFALSETGSLVYRPGSGVLGGTPVWVSRDGSEEVLDPTLTGSFSSPAISPLGGRVAFQYTPVGGRTDIWIYELPQGPLSRLTFEGRNTDPFWSPDGSEVGFSSDREGNFALYARAADFGGEVRLLFAEEGEGLFDAVWTPDGRRLVYRQGSVMTSDLLYVAPEPDSETVVFFEGPFGLNHPSISPDGRWLAYQGAESGQIEVYVRPFPGPGGRSQVSTGRGINPVWAHNGREIFYLDSGFLVVATVRTNPDFAVESREQLTSWTGYFVQAGDRHFEPSFDDQSFLAIRLDGPTGSGIRDIVVQNFIEELRERVPD